MTAPHPGSGGAAAPDAIVPPIDNGPVIRSFVTVCKILAKLDAEQRSRVIRAVNVLYEAEKAGVDPTPCARGRAL